MPPNKNHLRWLLWKWLCISIFMVFFVVAVPLSCSRLMYIWVGCHPNCIQYEFRWWTFSWYCSRALHPLTAHGKEMFFADSWLQTMFTCAVVRERMSVCMFVCFRLQIVAPQFLLESCVYKCVFVCVEEHFNIHRDNSLQLKSVFVFSCLLGV